MLGFGGEWSYSKPVLYDFGAGGTIRAKVGSPSKKGDESFRQGRQGDLHLVLLTNFPIKKALMADCHKRFSNFGSGGRI